jgi:hypothetical protein
MTATAKYQQILLRKPIRHVPADDNVVLALTRDSIDRLSQLPDMENLADEGWEIIAVHPDQQV